MRIDLAVPYEHKDKAKNLGARWDGAKRVWYLIDAHDLTPFLEWMPSISCKGKKKPAWQKVLETMR
jgi:hypothetical protein